MRGIGVNREFPQVVRRADPLGDSEGNIEFDRRVMGLDDRLDIGCKRRNVSWNAGGKASGDGEARAYGIQRAELDCAVGGAVPQCNVRADGGLRVGFDLPSILQPLEPFRNQLQVLSGMHGVDAEGPHARASTRFLTGVASQRDDGSNLRAGISMDQIAGRVLGRETQ
ncbi:MAG: DUF1552 domain-containing protein, partial [Candidatus Hydrogenedentes bacterium]|nr:DUF1552 domain-containing protein [Candidatus Hydrogenedentota bacterium]